MSDPDSKKEMTFTALVLGVLLAVVFGAANAYLGLRVGLTVSASVPAAVISMGVLRFVLRRDSILENNMVQTIGSAGESLAAGAIFTLPALYLWAEERPAEFAIPELLSVTLIALAGGTLGVLLMVPLRRPLIVDDKTLAYPEGLACADVLRAGETGAKHAKNVFVGLGVAAAVKFVTGWLKWIPETFVWPVRAVRGAVGFDVSPALLGVGYIVGPKISSFLFCGAMFGWMVLIPIIVATVPEATAMWDAGKVKAVWSGYVRYVGAGAIAVGGFVSLVRSLPTFFRAFKPFAGVSGEEGGEERAAGRDLPMKPVIGCLACLHLACPSRAGVVFRRDPDCALRVLLCGGLGKDGRDCRQLEQSNLRHDHCNARRIHPGIEGDGDRRRGGYGRGDSDRERRVHRRGDCG